MRTAIRDHDVLGALRPVDLIGYLRASGWVLETDIGNKASIWMLAGQNDTEVLVPHLRDAGDFAIRVGEVIRALEKIEDRSQEDILKDLFTTSSDLVRVRAIASESTDGTIPLDTGVRLVEHARDMLLAAACAAVSTRAYWARRKPIQATEFVEGVRMGQTERGSYVLTIYSPVPPELKTNTPTDSPFERKVTHTLTRALASVRDAAQRAIEIGDLLPFREAIAGGVSANLCDALVGLGHVSPNQGIEVSVSWSRSRPLDGTPRSTIAIAADFIPVIEEASRLFKEIEPLEDVEIYGFVERLDRPIGNQTGQVWIHTIIDNQHRRVLVELSDPEYQEAVRVHKEAIPITCTGELIKKGRSLYLQNPRHFKILALPQSAE